MRYCSFYPTSLLLEAPNVVAVHHKSVFSVQWPSLVTDSRSKEKCLFEESNTSTSWNVLKPERMSREEGMFYNQPVVFLKESRLLVPLTFNSEKAKQNIQFILFKQT